MNLKKFTLGISIYAATTLAKAGQPVPLPVIEGGLLTVAVIGLVVGIRIIKRKK